MVNVAFIQLEKKYFLPEQNYRPNSQILDVSRPECGVGKITYDGIFERLLL
jgi:hypothetical protein